MSKIFSRGLSFKFTMDSIGYINSAFFLSKKSILDYSIYLEFLLKVHFFNGDRQFSAGGRDLLKMLPDFSGIQVQGNGKTV